MRIKPLATFLAAVSLSTAGFAQTAQPDFTADAFRSHVTFLADDLLEGRDTGSRGHEIAARYVATQLMGLGLQPAAGGSYYQQVPFVRYAMTDAPATLRIGNRSFRHGQEILFRPSPQDGRLQMEAPLVFAGYGLDAPQYGGNDYRGLDVRGRIAVVIDGLPEGLPSDVAAHLMQSKARMAAQHGAVGLIVLRSPAAAERMPWQRLVAGAGRPGMTWVAPDGQPFSSSGGVRFTAYVDTPAAEALFQGARRSYAQVMSDIAANRRPAGFALRPRVAVDRTTTITERFQSPNVVAVLPGTDPALANEYVLLMGHLDHVGTHEGEGDQIHNGALDNATGIATLLEVAREMSESGNRPRRPILFAAVTAEEKGLLGAEYLAHNPVTRNGRVAAVVNLDMPVLLYDFSDVIAFGAEHSTLGPIVSQAGGRMNVALTPDPLPQEGLFTRSDHYRFVQQGIPSVFLMTGFAGEGQQRFTEFLRTNYHSPRDDLNQPIDWQAGAKFAQLNYLIASEIANADAAPRWYSDSFFGTMLAPQAPKAERP